MLNEYVDRQEALRIAWLTLSTLLAHFRGVIVDEHNKGFIRGFCEYCGVAQPTQRSGEPAAKAPDEIYEKNISAKVVRNVNQVS